MKRNLLKVALFFINVLIIFSIPSLSSGQEVSSQAKSWVEKGYKYAADKQYQSALDAFNKAIAIDPNYSKAYVQRGNVYDVMGRYEKAIQDYKKAQSIYPNNAEAYYHCGLAHGRKEKHAEAIQEFTRAIEIKPDAKSFYNRGLAYSKSNDLDMAIKDFTKTIELWPKFDMAYHDRGLAYSRKGMWDKAIEDYSQSISVNPKLAAAYHKRAVAYKNKGLTQKATEDLEKASTLYIDTGISYASQGNYDKAQQFFNEAVEANPDNPYCYYNLACLYSLKKDIPNACKNLEKAIAKGYNNWKVIREDSTLKNLRQSPCYKKIIPKLI